MNKEKKVWEWKSGEYVTARVVGTKGSGKSTFVAHCIGHNDNEPCLPPLIQRLMDEKKEVHYIMTSDQVGFDVMVEFKDYFVDKNDFDSAHATVIAKLLQDNMNKGGYVDLKNETTKNELQTSLSEKLSNIKQWRFLSEDNKKDILVESTNLVVKFVEGTPGVLYRATNKLDVIEIKSNRESVFRIIKGQVEEELNCLASEMLKIYEAFNNYLKNTLTCFFEEGNRIYCKLSDERYSQHFDTLDTAAILGCPINGTFTMLTPLIDKIYIKMPLSSRFKKFFEDFKEDDVNRKHISDTDLNLFQDYTTGLFSDKAPACIEIIDSEAICEGQEAEMADIDTLSHPTLLDGNEDILFLMNSLTDDISDISNNNLLAKAFKYYSKRVPVYVINTKLDLYASRMLRDEKYNFIEKPDAVIVNVSQIVGATLRNNQKCLASSYSLNPLTCALKYEIQLPQVYQDKYSVIQVLNTIFAHRSQNSGTKYRVVEKGRLVGNRKSWTVVDRENSKIEIDKAQLKEKVKAYLDKLVSTKKLLESSLKDVNLNEGRRPSEKAYKKLRGQLKYGRNFSSRMEDSPYYNEDCIAVGFTSQLRDFVSKDFVYELLDSIDVAGRTLREEKTGTREAESARFKECIWQSICEEDFKKVFVSELVYNKVLLEAERNNVGYGNKFNALLRNCREYFCNCSNDSVLEAYVGALELMLYQAVEYTLNRNMILAKEDPAHE
ncbi:MAG: hypothetical protein IKJ73_08180 [Lachnospiraceae bacterium]|nr:hypothetical protein [Lachnospiraceae bacterium]